MKTNLVICIALAAVTLVVYAQVVQFDFISLDDHEYVTRKAIIYEGITAEGIEYAFTQQHAANWHPLTTLSHMLDCELFGTNPGAHHAVNLVLHVLNTLLLFGLLRSLTGAAWRSAIVAALFAVHPLHVESVAWVSERKDLLSACFWILTTWAYAAYARRGGLARYGLVFGLFAVGSLAKPMVVTLPFTLLLLDYWPLRRISFGRDETGARNRLWPAVRLVGEKIPLMALSFALCAVTWAVQMGNNVITMEMLSLPQRLANTAVSYVWYLVKTVWPGGLAVRYPHPYLAGGTPWEWWQVAASAVILVAVTVFVFLALKRRYAVAGWLWFMGTLVPVIGIVQVGVEGRSDRYTYIPAIGLFWLIVWGLAGVAERCKIKPAAAAAATVIVLAALSAAAFRQVGHWRGSESLFAHAITASENNYLAHHHLAMVLTEQGRLEEAVEQYRETVRINPSHPAAHNNLGLVLARLGRPGEAARHFLKTLQINPDHAEARANLGLILMHMRRYEEAARHFARALELRPGNADMHYNLGAAQAKLGRLGEARHHFEEALRIEPGHKKTRNAIKQIKAVKR